MEVYKNRNLSRVGKKILRAFAPYRRIPSELHLMKNTRNQRVQR